MRFVKVNSEKGDNSFNNRNCIAFSKTRTDNETEINISKHETKTFKNILNNIKELFNTTYSDISKKVICSVVTAISAFAAVAVFNTNFSFAYNAFFNGTELGYVPGKSYVQKCVDSINSEFAHYSSGEDIISGEIAVAPAIIKKNAFTDADTLKENIKSTSDVMVKSFAIEIDGKAYTALETKEGAESVLNTILSSYRLSDETELSFKENVSITQKYIPAVILLPESGAIERLSGYTTIFTAVSVPDKTTFTAFADENGLDATYLKSLNPSLSENISRGEEIVIPVYKPVLTVLSSETVSYEKTVPFTEEVAQDDSMYKGTEKILSKGKNGTNIITEKIERANGKVINQTIVKSEEVSSPVMQLRAVGTLERPDYVGTGSFIRPYYGQISSRFGSRRSGNHTGVDFCGNTGDDILAADNGTVVFSGWSGGYGKIIKIDHNNGYVTYYAHCSELYVKEGDTVKKGQVIAALGNTGNSTGPHVHFEVHYDGELCNPMNYVD